MTLSTNLRYMQIIRLSLACLYYVLRVITHIYSQLHSLRAQERPATLILTVTSGLRFTRARHVNKRQAQIGNLKFCSSIKNDRSAKNVSITNTGREKSVLQER